MTLRTKVILTYLVGLTVLVATVAGAFFLTKTLADQRLVAVTLTGQGSTWRKVRDAAFQRMQFYAHDASPGKPSIWRLRGRRSPIAAIASGNKKRIAYVIGPLHRRLVEAQVLDYIWIFDADAEPLAAFAPTSQESNEGTASKGETREFPQLAKTMLQKKRTQIGINVAAGKHYATIAFPIYANARVVGGVVYAKRLPPLIDDLARNTRTQVVLRDANGTPAYVSDQALEQVVAGSQGELPPFTVVGESARDDVIVSYKERHYSVTHLLVEEEKELGDMVLLTDVTETYNKERRYVLLTGALLAAITLLVAIGANALLRRGFRPLDKAIDVLNALARGDTTVDLDLRNDEDARDEVGRIASTVKRFRQSLIEREKIRGLFGKYVPERVAEQVLRQDGALEPQLVTATVVFVDLAGFTSMTEALEPRMVVEILNDYFSEVTEIIEKNDGVITQFQGDAVLAIFNVPLPDPDHAEHALASARSIVDLMHRRTFGGQRLSCRIGITTGEVVAGNVGAADRLNYTVHGDVVNLAARLEQMNKTYGTRILAAESLVAHARPDDFTLIGNVDVRGKRESVNVYTLKDLEAPSS